MLDLAPTFVLLPYGLGSQGTGAVRLLLFQTHSKRTDYSYY